jgi:hypothetical protein
MPGSGSSSACCGIRLLLRDGLSSGQNAPVIKELTGIDTTAEANQLALGLQRLAASATGEARAVISQCQVFHRDDSNLPFRHPLPRHWIFFRLMLP